MKREELEKLGITDKEVLDKIMALNGQDIEGQKTLLNTEKQRADGLVTQLADATKQIEGFKGMKPEDVEGKINEWKTKAETAQQEAAKQISQVKFDAALGDALKGAKAKNPATVKALLKHDLLKLNEADGSISGLKEQLENIVKENDYLFESDVPTPAIVAGANNKSVNLDAVTEAARVGAGLTATKEK